MIAATLRFVLALTLGVLALANATVVVEYVALLIAVAREEPAEMVRLVTIVFILYVTLMYARRMASSRTVHTSAALTALVPARHDHGFGLVRKARHEAAHAVIALTLGREDVEADLFVRGPSGGQTRYAAGTAPAADAAFEDMVICYAGHLVDIDAGHYDHGSVSDMRCLMDYAILILSTGARPARHDGALTLDALVRSSRDVAATILDDHRDTVGRIADSLAQSRALDDAQLRSLFTGAPTPNIPVQPAG